MKLRVNLGERGYDICVQRGALSDIGSYLSLDRKVLIVTDTGVPAKYAEAVALASADPVLGLVPCGETSKCMERYTELLRVLCENGFTRSDCVVAVGGGVVGDLAGFVAATYLRGIDFYNIPTTLLSMVDSSVGGKVAVDFGGYKNTVGAFYQPRRVVIDPDTLSTLDARQVANGHAEAFKTALIADKELYEIYASGKANEKIETVIERSLRVKAGIVERDEKESGERKLLNFGHTLAHAVESADGFGTLLHGECVAIGMVPMVGDGLRPEVVRILKSLGLPTAVTGNKERILDAVGHDKKKAGDSISLVRVDTVGKGEIVCVPWEEYREQIRVLFAKENES